MVTTATRGGGGAADGDDGDPWRGVLLMVTTATRGGVLLMVTTATRGGGVLLMVTTATRGDQRGGSGANVKICKNLTNSPKNKPLPREGASFWGFGTFGLGLDVVYLFAVESGVKSPKRAKLQKGAFCPKWPNVNKPFVWPKYCKSL